MSQIYIADQLERRAKALSRRISVFRRSPNRTTGTPEWIAHKATFEFSQLNVSKEDMRDQIYIYSEDELWSCSHKSALELSSSIVTNVIIILLPLKTVEMTNSFLLCRCLVRNSNEIDHYWSSRSLSEQRVFKGV